MRLFSSASLAFLATLTFLIPIIAEAKSEVFYCVEEKNIQFDSVGGLIERPLRKFTVKVSSDEGKPDGPLYQFPKYEHYVSLKGWTQSNEPLIFPLTDFGQWLAFGSWWVAYRDGISLRMLPPSGDMTVMWNDVNNQYYIKAKCEKF